MRKVSRLPFALAAIAILAALLRAQKDPKTANSAPLVLTGAIPLENVHGRIDHFGFDPKNRLFVSALGNNTEEVIDLSAQRVVLTPQGVVYSPETNKLFVASLGDYWKWTREGASFAALRLHLDGPKRLVDSMASQRSVTFRSERKNR